VCEVTRNNQAVCAHECFPRCAHALFAGGREGYVRGAGVAAVEGPFCFAVADYEDARGGHGELMLRRVKDLRTGSLRELVL
jgi:hypothetical protein